MKKIVLIAIFLTLATIQQVSKSKPCKCTELIVDTDCDRSPECQWDNYKLRCQDKVKTDTDVVQLTEGTKALSLLPTKTHSAYCQEFNKDDCFKQSSCAWVNNGCTHFTGCSAFSQSENDDCMAISSRCISDGFRCVEVGECYTYKSQKSCVFNQQNQACYWNSRNSKCENTDTCDKLPATLKTDKECRQNILSCTVKEEGGCVLSGYSCSDQMLEIQCVTNRLGDIDCLWVDGICRNKECQNAPITLTTDEECQLFKSICTTKNGGGCVKRTTCVDATNEASCSKDFLGNDCFWNGQSCSERLCEKGLTSFNTNEQCQSILPKCITNGAGCINNITCASASTKETCFQDSNGNQCIWNGIFCSMKTCENAGNQYQGDVQCTAYMSKCTGRQDNQPGCMTKTCETAPISLNTNQKCDEYLQNNKCITKIGGGCRQNTNCFSIDLEIACIQDNIGNSCYWDDIQSRCYSLSFCPSIKNVKNCLKDSQGKECQWIIPSSEKQNPYCETKSCFTAPKTLITEKDCQKYFTPSDEQQSCTTVKGGGCVIKQQCHNAQVQAACITDFMGNKCQWDTILSSCRLMKCSDMKGSTHLECNNQMKQCTVGNAGYCNDIQECNSIQNQSNCIFGVEGPCIWITDYPNTDGSKGFCFKYNSCDSFHWTTDKMCKMISPNCTTNGDKCISITDCAHTNTNGGCVTGTDGNCVQTVKSLESKEPEVCRRFFRCMNAYYLTHDECQKANPSCTTDGIFGCMELTSCSQYIEEACHFNDSGVVKNKNGQIISTGKCVWNQAKGTCQDESCSNLSFTTPQQCSNRLSLCTSNGQECVPKVACQIYSTEDKCVVGGSDGACLWLAQTETNPSQCRLMKCSDIVNGNTEQACSQVDNCITDGKQCIPVSICSSYKTKQACNFNGTDGICIWSSEAEGNCSLMKNCAQASNDEKACNYASDRCTWNKDQSQSSKCVEHTCQTYKEKVGYCQYFLTWNYSQYIFCKTVQDQCVQVDLSVLSEEDCYPLTVYQYAWNPISNKCSKCDKTQTNSNKTKVNDNSTITTSLGYMASLLVSLLTF